MQFFRNLIPILGLFVFLGLFTTTGSAWAHVKGENYVWLNVDEDHLSGWFEFRIEDLENRLGVTVPETPEERLQKLREVAPQVQEYLSQHFDISAQGREIPLEFRDIELSEQSDDWIVFSYRTPTMETPGSVDIRNSIFLGYDDFLHRSVIVHSYNKVLGAEYGEEHAIMSFGPRSMEQALDFADLPELLGAKRFLVEGILHTLLGFDHVLFIIALLLTSVLTPSREGGALVWRPIDSLGDALWNVLKIVTLFTIAHSVTLSLAALGLVSINSRFVESVIALSIIALALNNIFARFNDKRWLLIFVFGLFHGLGFASVMGDLPFRMVEITGILIRFNIGIEIGQVAIVLVIFPILFALRHRSFYRPVIQIGLSCMIAAIALYWFVERAFAL